VVKKTIHSVEYNIFDSEAEEVIKRMGRSRLLLALKQMLLVRQFELRAEAAYQHGKVGGFFHSYIGQEAIQTAAICAMGTKNNWWITTYRCHALALLLGATPDEMMAELYGKVTGNAKGRGGSMHMYQERMLGGFGIVGGHLPVATGAAFSLKYKREKGVAVCFLGEGCCAQGTIHESLNLASLWDLPCIYVIENNHWGMGTAVNRALCAQPIVTHLSKAYKIKGYALDGMDFFNCYAGFSHVFNEVCNTRRPALIEAMTERFRGHSISDPGLYRSKEELKQVKAHDPLLLLKRRLQQEKILTDQEFQAMEMEQKERVLSSMKYAEESPPPKVTALEEDVLAP